MKTHVALWRATALAAFAAGAAIAAAPLPPDVPPSLRPPAGQQLFLEARAAGVQIYECAAKAEAPVSFEWTLRAPEATLTDPAGRVLGKHYAGPTWESSDGSAVVGEVKAREVGPKPAAIPWLLLSAKSTSGEGIFTATASIQRIQTSGGIAPAESCDAGVSGKVIRVPYSAIYYFYRASP